MSYKAIKRHAWATLWQGWQEGTHHLNPTRPVYAVSTIDSGEDYGGQDFLHEHNEEMCSLLFGRKITLDEFYENSSFEEVKRKRGLKRANQNQNQ